MSVHYTSVYDYFWKNVQLSLALIYCGAGWFVSRGACILIKHIWCSVACVFVFTVRLESEKGRICIFFMCSVNFLVNL